MMFFNSGIARYKEYVLSDAIGSAHICNGGEFTHYSVNLYGPA
jgi:hypothetical protein